MAIIERKDVELAAKMARIAVTQDEVSTIHQQLDAVLEQARVLSEVDTEGVEPMAHAVSHTNVLRADDVRPSLPREKALANAPDARDGYFYVPRILDE